MEVVKVECDEYLQHVNMEKLQSNEQCVAVNEQIRDSEAKEKLDCYKNEPFSTANNIESTQESDAHNECINEEFFKHEQNFSSYDQLCNGVKQEIDNEQDTNDALFKEEWRPNIQERNYVGICDLPNLEMRNNAEEFCIDKIEESVSGMEQTVITDQKKIGEIRQSSRIGYITNHRNHLNNQDIEVQATVVSSGLEISRTNCYSEKRPEIEAKMKRRNLRCTFCDYTTVDEVDFRNHGITVHHQFICGSCKFSTPLEFCFKRHVSIKHPVVSSLAKQPIKQSKNYKCDVCDYSSSNKTNVVQHNEAVHLKLKHFACHLCDFKTCRRTGLNIHVDAVHLKRKVFECPSCDYGTARVDTLKKHIDSVHLQKKHLKCPTCDYRTGFKNRLKEHVQVVHSDEKYPECKVCGLKTKRKYELAVHVRSEHLKLETYKCPTCEYTAIHESTLEIHVNAVHLKLKNHKCHLCDYSSSRKAGLQRHIKSIHLKL